MWRRREGGEEGRESAVGGRQGHVGVEREAGWGECELTSSLAVRSALYLSSSRIASV